MFHCKMKEIFFLRLLWKWFVVIDSITFHSIFPPVTWDWVVAQTTFSPATSSSASGGTYVFQGLDGMCSPPPACPELAPGSLPHERTYRRHPDQMAGPGSSGGSQLSELLTISLRPSPATLRRKLISASRIHDPPGCALFNTPQRTEKCHYFKYKLIKVSGCHIKNSFLAPFPTAQV